MDKQKLERALLSFKKKISAGIYEKEYGMIERTERINYYQSFTAEKIKVMETSDFYEYIGKLWSMLIWGNKKHIVDKIIEDNTLDSLKKHLIDLLHGKGDIVIRWNNFLKNIKRMGPATISELLSYNNPNEYVIFNKNTSACFNYLGIDGMPKYNYQFTGKKYHAVCQEAKEISNAMKKHGLDDVSLLAVDYFLYDEILPMTYSSEMAEGLPDATSTPNSNTPATVTESLHNDIIDMIVEIGEFLGFESSSEVKIETGAKVDAMWEAKIGNMGKVIYVFEVQSKGSIDSLLLNLIKANNTPGVQAVVAVSDAAQIEKIKKENVKTGLLQDTLRTWDFKDVIEVHEALDKAHISINKLGLVPKSFI